MGLVNNKGERKQYVYINDSHFAIKSREGEDGAVSRANKKGEVVWEKRYNTLSAHITFIEKSVKEWEGKKIISWNISMQEVLDEFVLSLPYNGREAKSLLTRLPNIDLDAEVTLHVGKVHDKDKGKDIPYMTIYQHGKKIDPAYTRESPDYPQMKKTKFKGEEVWDDTDQMEFLENLVAKYFTKKVEVEDVDEVESTEGTDELPF